MAISLQAVFDLYEVLRATLRKLDQTPGVETNPDLLKLRRILLRRIAVLDGAPRLLNDQWARPIKSRRLPTSSQSSIRLDEDTQMPPQE
jgi:hypothetical protein